MPCHPPGHRRCTALIDAERGSLFIEYLIVLPAFAMLLFLTLWVYKYNGLRSEHQESVMSCAMAYAAGGCQSLPPECQSVGVATEGYLGGALPLSLGGNDAVVSRQETIAGVNTLPMVPKLYESRARVACNPRDGIFSPPVVAGAVCMLTGKAAECAALAAAEALFH